MIGTTHDNPFSHNYVFSRADINRSVCRPSLQERAQLLFAPTHCQIDDGCVFYYKVLGSRYYLLRIEKPGRESYSYDYM